MSSDAVMFEPVHLEPEDGLIYCPHCDYKIPDNIMVCWNCGGVVQKHGSQ